MSGRVAVFGGVTTAMSLCASLGVTGAGDTTVAGLRIDEFQDARVSLLWLSSAWLGLGFLSGPKRYMYVKIPHPPILTDFSR